MSAIVFAGPTLPAAEVSHRLPDAVALPPARQGDVFRAVRDHRPRALGLIDGVFLHEPAVWHRELLWAMREGVHVFGAASMGALRAAELSALGMRGVGKVFAAYRDGVWPGFSDAFEDDDEVAVVHAPAELGSAPLCDAMVDLRDTLLAAEAAGVLARDKRDLMCAALKALPFAARSIARLASLGPAAFRAWLPTGRVARKRLDAEAMLAAMADLLRDDPAPFVPPFRFEHVHAWEVFVAAEAPPLSAEEALVLEELRLRPNDWRDAACAALGRLAAADAPDPTDAETRRAFGAFRVARGLARRADLDAWLADNALDHARFSRLLREEAALAAAAPPGLPAAIADHLRLTGAFAPLLRRARAKQAALATSAAPAHGPEFDGALISFAEQNHVPLDDLRNDPGLAAAVWREYRFRRRVL